MFPSAFQDMHARMPALSCAAERASPGGLKTYSAIHEQHCGARGFSSTVQAMPPWRTSCLSSTSLFLQQVTSIHEEVQEHCVRWGLWHFDTGSTSLAQRAGRHESRHRCDRAASSPHEIRQRCLQFQLRRFMRRPTSEITSCSAVQVEFLHVLLRFSCPLRLQPRVHCLWPAGRSILRFLLQCQHALRLQCTATERDGFERRLSFHEMSHEGASSTLCRSPTRRSPSRTSVPSGTEETPRGVSARAQGPTGPTSGIPASGQVP